MTLLLSTGTLKEAVARWGLVYSPTCLVTGRGGMGYSCARGGLGWILGGTSLLKGLLGIGMGCPGKWLSYHSWRSLRDVQMLNLVIWFSGGLVSVRSGVGLGDLGGLFQPRRFCDSVNME